MEIDNIIEIKIDNQGRLVIKPEKKEFNYIYRAAMEVNWDDKNKFLYSPKPREWGYLNWYQQILKATFSEYKCKLIITDKTSWINIPKELKEEISRLPKEV